jgi:septum formation protein
MHPLILASSSPRRREILESLGFSFGIMTPDTDESVHDHLEVEERVLRLAEDKAMAVARDIHGGRECLVLGADTLVRLRAGGNSESAVLGKPRDRSEAGDMMRALAGRSHDVYTGIALVGYPGLAVQTIRSESRVTFAPMTGEEIEEYLDSGDWEGVAGAYKVQGRAALYIEGIEGSWSGIMGLPIRELYVILKRAAFPWSELVPER